MRKHVLITGGAGFIGSSLCERFHAEGYAVTALDNLATGRRSNLAALAGQPDFAFVEADARDPVEIDSLALARSHGLHGILHLACPASPVDFERMPLEILDLGSIAVSRLGRVALDRGCRFLIASTSEIYGDPLVHPQPESYWGNVSTTGPRACYDESKRFAEAWVTSAMRLKGLDGRIARIFNTYGPRMRLEDGRIVPELCRQLILGQPLTVHGDGLQTRSYCFVTDLVDGLFRLYQGEYRGPVNLGNPSEVTVLEFASELLALGRELGFPVSRIEHSLGRPDDPRRRCPVISLAREKLGWEPRVSLREGLGQTLGAWAKELRSR